MSEGTWGNKLLLADVPVGGADTGWKFVWHVQPTKYLILRRGVSATEICPNSDNASGNKRVLLYVLKRAPLLPLCRGLSECVFAHEEASTNASFNSTS